MSMDFPGPIPGRHPDHPMTDKVSSLASTCASDAAGSTSGFAVRDADFYRNYAWCLNIYPTVANSLARLRAELARCSTQEEPWRRREILTNIYLHCCAVADTTDDFLIGAAYDLSKVSLIPFSALAIRGFNALLNLSRRVRQIRLASVHKWRRSWRAAVQDFLRTSLVSDSVPDPELIQRLHDLSLQDLPSDLLAEVAKVPAAFRSQDMSHHDVFSLGKQLVAAFQERQRPILIVGCRTAGSYFAPVLAAYLQANGFSDVDSVTLRPKKGIPAWEQAQLASYASKSGQAVVIDEPINTGNTYLKAIDILQKAGFQKNISIATPVHASRSDWNSGLEVRALTQFKVFTLEPEHWYKRSVMTEDSVVNLMREWLGDDTTRNVAVSSDAASEAANRQLAALSEQKFHNRLKRVYRVDLCDVSGHVSTRYVIAKGVGWGWYGYHAVLASQRLQSFLPPLIGFRDGVLFQEWICGQEVSADLDRTQFVDRAAEYVAERSRVLKLDHDPVRALIVDNRHKATDELSSTLSRAYGSRPAATFRRSLLREWLTAEPCPLPTLIDGKMRVQEWAKTRGQLVKTDFEQHGMGKTELNAIDPAYDLADAILQWRLSAAEEARLVERYVAKSGDAQIKERLQLNKMLAGLWAMLRAAENLSDPRLAARHQEFNRSYIDAWTFLIVQMARFAGDLCEPKPHPGWHAPLVVMDIDGVIDKQIFGFPSTTASGIRAISLFHAHNCALAINSARSVTETKEYCNAYRMVGAVAEYGAYVWDAVSDKEQILVSSESLQQLQILANELRQIPGVFLNDDYKYSIRAFTYHNDVTTALPKPVIQNLVYSLRLDRLAIHQTFLDTAVTAKETDKGRGLLALLELGGQSPEDVIAIGDSEPDLPMFRVVKRSFAPAHILCKRPARLLGCQITNGNYQVGLLDAARKIVHNDGHRCKKCEENEKLLMHNKSLLVHLLKVADAPKISSLLKAMLNRRALASLRQ